MLLITIDTDWESVCVKKPVAEVEKVHFYFCFLLSVARELPFLTEYMFCVPSVNSVGGGGFRY